jgi:membrane-bound lytic murein transglycosylase MltF
MIRLSSVLIRRIQTVFAVLGVACLLQMPGLRLSEAVAADEVPDQPAAGLRAEEQAVLERLGKPQFGDFAAIRERRILRVLVSYSKTNFFIDESTGRPHGFEFELLEGYVKQLNDQIKGTYGKVKVAYIPVPFSELLSDLEAGKGDIAAAGLTVTAARAKSVDFTEPYLRDVREVVVHNKAESGIASTDDLAERTVHVKGSSSYVTGLEAFNERLKAKGKTPMKVVEEPAHIESEELLEMVNAGAVALTVVDEHVALAWSRVLPEIRVRDDLVVNDGGSIAWAVRKDSPELRKSLDAYLQKVRKGTLHGNILHNRYFIENRWIRPPMTRTDLQRAEQLTNLFKKYGEQYGIDWLALLAQGFQESRLDQSVRSPAGAVGIMQLLPSTAAGKAVAISNIEKLENNIEAGAKYMTYLRDTYFNEPNIPPADRLDFSWAAYNAGPTRIQRLRKEARERGLDPDRWFFNVEVLAAEQIGRETVGYVDNINKYYITYRHYAENRAAVARRLDPRV